MTRKTAILLTCAALAVGCGRTQTAHRNDQNYQVVQEGQASGVTSTINAPGETPPPMTDTAVDTTTAFTLPDNPAPLGTQQPNTVAGTLPAYPSPYPPAYPPSSVRPRVQPPMSSTAQPRPQPAPTDTSATQAPPVTDTSATQAPPPTDTTKTDTVEKTDAAPKTDTAPPPTSPV